MPKTWPMAVPPRPSHHANDSKTSFKNPWPSAGAPTWAELRFPLGWYKESLNKHVKARELKVVSPDWGKAARLEKSLDRNKCAVGTWLGHASTLLDVPLEGTASDGEETRRLWLLFDPIFSMRAGPTQYTGPTRMKKSPCQVDDLPGCDAVIISHNHYDHLDLASIKAISKRFPKAKYFVPLGNKTWLSSTGVPAEMIFELDWWENREYSLQDFGHEQLECAKDETLLRFTCVPAQHNSGRAAIDQGNTLWCGWVIEQLLSSKDESSTSKLVRRGAFYHAGDTGYRRTASSTVVCPVFEEIGKKFGPFDLSFLPIWRGGTLGFISYVGLRLSHQDIPSTFHASPADAIAIHKDVKSRNTIGVHFGTFIGSENESYEAIIEFEEARESNGIRSLADDLEADHTRAGVVDIGASFAVKL